MVEEIHENEQLMNKCFIVSNKSAIMLPRFDIELFNISHGFSVIALNSIIVEIRTIPISKKFWKWNYRNLSDFCYI